MKTTDRYIKFLLTVMAVTMLAGCGGGSGSSPTTPTPTIVQVAGLWRVTTRLASVSGGECVGAAYASFVGGQIESTLSIQQSGANLTGTQTTLSNGATCQVTGTAG